MWLYPSGIPTCGLGVWVDRLTACTQSVMWAFGVLVQFPPPPVTSLWPTDSSFWSVLQAQMRFQVWFPSQQIIKLCVLFLFIFIASVDMAELQDCAWARAGCWRYTASQCSALGSRSPLSPGEKRLCRSVVRLVGRFLSWARGASESAWEHQVSLHRGGGGWT